MKKKNHTCDHIGLLSGNAKRLARFYTKKLGFKKTKEELLPTSIMQPIFHISCDCIFIKLVSGKVMIELFEPTSLSMRRRHSDTAGIHHWGYCVGDREKFVSQLKKKNVKIITVKRNDHSVYFITDPDGNRIEIRDNKK